VLKDFKAFVMRGNVMDLAVAVVLAAAFGKIVTSFVDDVLMPPLGLMLGGMDFKDLFIDLSGQGHPTLAAAKAAGAATLNYGAFLNTLVQFLIVAFAIFVLVRQVERFSPRAAASTRECPQCLSAIPLKALRCPNCTSVLTA
jgi:large conductance mechanosensitive channel